MRGSPLLRAAITFAALLLLAPLLWRMTQAKPTVPGIVEVKSSSGAQEIQIALTFTTSTKRVGIVHLGQAVWSKDAPESQEEFSLKLPWPREGGELKFKVEWAEGAALSAMRVQLTDPADNKIERSLWGKGTVERVLNFP